MEKFDKIIIGAGLYGLYSALFCCKRGQKVLILECDPAPFQRATYINQARVHQGYHYPRSLATAMKSAEYFERFCKEYAFCINKEFEQIYATSNQYSWSDRRQFKNFCRAAKIPCEELHPDYYFKHGICDGVFRTREYTYDAKILCEYLLEKLKSHTTNGNIKYNVNITKVNKLSDVYEINTADGAAYRSGFVLNATYAGVNQILDLASFKKFEMKYELCEIILCDVNEKLKHLDFTIMDGPFFSIMPFGKTGLHSLTSVTFTPHTTSYEVLPAFECQKMNEGYCTAFHLKNCNSCPAKPETAFPYMAGLAKKYMREDYCFTYRDSLYSMKPILKNSEIDDSRPTIIKIYSRKPTFVSVLSGKINTVYDLDEVLGDEE